MPAHPDGPQALTGMTVLDLSQVMAGPFCTMILGDLGADVIKVENPSTGDQTRTGWGAAGPSGDSRAFLALNRNKRSVTIDLKDEADRERFYALVAEADVVVENFRPGVAARLGVGYEDLAARNPGLIYASISGFGQDGPYAQRPGYDLIAQAMAGVMSVTGEPGGRPVKAGIPVADLGSGLFTVVGILAAWSYKQRTGQGQYLETSLFESALALSVWETVEYWSTGEVPAPLGSAHRLLAPYQALATRDGYITVAGNNQRLWQRLCDALGDGALAQDPRFDTNDKRMANLPELVTVLEERLAARGTAEWVEILLAAGVPAGPIQNYQQLLEEDPHVAERGMVTSFAHPVDGDIAVIASPIRLSVTPPRVTAPAPLLGQHNEEILTAGEHAMTRGKA